MKSLLSIVGFALVIMITKNEAAKQLNSHWNHQRNLSNIIDFCQAQSTWTLVHNNGDCRKFYVCSKDKIEEFNCAVNYYFNAEQMRCMPGNCDANPETPNNNDVLCIPYSVQRVPEDCTQYRHCIEGIYRIKPCQKGKYFDASVNSCLPVDITPRHQCSCLMPDNTTLPNPNDCESYYRCTLGQAVLHSCPQNHYYERRVGSCLLDLSGVCLEKQSIVPAKSMDTALVECQRALRPTAPHATNCAKFYLCSLDGSSAYEMSCPSGKYYDPVKGLCQLDINNECDSNFELIDE